MTNRRLEMSSVQFMQLLDQAHRGLPGEVCGILGGLNSRVEEIFPIHNVSQHPDDSFTMDPAELIRVLSTVEDRGWSLLAMYHSHPPGSRTDPSPRDRIGASYPGSLQVIVVPDRNGFAGIIRAFEMTPGGVPSEVLVVTDGPSASRQQPNRL